MSWIVRDACKGGRLMRPSVKIPSHRWNRTRSVSVVGTSSSVGVSVAGDGHKPRHAAALAVLCFGSSPFLRARKTNVITMRAQVTP